MDVKIAEIYSQWTYSNLDGTIATKVFERTCFKKRRHRNSTICLSQLCALYNINKRGPLKLISTRRNRNLLFANFLKPYTCATFVLWTQKLSNSVELQHSCNIKEGSWKKKLDWNESEFAVFYIQYCYWMASQPSLSRVQSRA